jgi:transposase
MRWKELFAESRNRIVSKHRPGEGYQNISAALNVSKNTVASIICKWKKFETTKTPPRTVCPAKLTNQRRAMVREVNKNLMVTLTEFQSSSVEMGELSLQHSTNQAFKVEWPDGSHSLVKGT